MEDLTTSLIVVVITLFIIVLIFWFTNRYKAQKEQKIKKLAADKVWIYEPIRERLAWGYYLKTKSWVFKAISVSSEQHDETGSSNVANETSWLGKGAVSPQHTLIIREKPASPPASPAIIQLQQMLQKNFESRTAGLSEVQVRPSALQERYLFLANTPDMLESLLTPSLIQQLVNWQGKPPLITVGSDGIRLELEGLRVEKPEEILKIVRLGETLLETQSP